MLKEAEEKWQEYPEELYKKGLSDPDNHADVVTHIETDILVCEVVGFGKHYYKQSKWR